MLRSAVIYGANASGKSNVLKAMSAMRRIVTTSAERSSTAEIDVEPFLLSTETENAPSYFEVVFMLKGIRYRYGFEADREAIISEWLYVAKKDQEKPLFLREGDGIEVLKDFKEGKGLEERTRDNALFLAVCDQFNGLTAKQVLHWFRVFLSLSGVLHEDYRMILSKFMTTDFIRKTIMNLIRSFDLGFVDIRVENRDKDDELINAIRKLAGNDVIEFFEGQLTGSVKTIHRKYDSNKEYIGDMIFDMDKNESEGTKKYLTFLHI